MKVNGKEKINLMSVVNATVAKVAQFEAESSC